MDLSIIIINWNSENYLAACLRSVYGTVKEIDFEVIVWDNASYDGSAELVKREFPQAIFIQSAENHGFAKANNLAFQRTSGNNVLLLNPDTELIGDAVAELLSCLKALSDAGAVGCRLVNSDGTIQTTCLQAFPTILNQALDVDFLKRRFPTWKMWGMHPLFHPSQVPVRVEMICGACIMIRRGAFQAVGLLTAAYRMYGDDLDLCYKLHRSGYGVYYTGRATVIHHGGKSSCSLQKGLPDVWTKAAIYRFLANSRGALYGELYLAILAMAALGRVIILGCLIPFERLNNSGRKLALLKWRMIGEWAIGSKRPTDPAIRLVAECHAAGSEADPGLQGRSR